MTVARLAVVLALGILIVAGIASASTDIGAEPRVWGTELQEQALFGGAALLTLELHLGCRLAYGGLASSCLFVPKGGGELSKQAQKSIRSLEKQIAKHEDKLADFKASPTVRPGMENLPEAVIRQQQARRIQHLGTEIQTFKNNIEKVRGNL
jgi:hypothetical protein